MFKQRWLFVFISVLLASVATTQTADERPRARDLGIEPGIFPPGPHNAITDVAGVLVGHTTVIEGDNVRTGVTAILPHGGNVFQDKVAGGIFIGNAFGKLAGSTQVLELGVIETPIILTNTLSVGRALEAVVAYTLAQEGNEDVVSVNALVGETNDSHLNDIRGMHITREHVLSAIRNASDGPVTEGSVGAGTGTQMFGWKGGIGTSSRVLPERYGGYTVGVLIQASFGGVLTIDGAPVGKELGQHAFSRSAGPDAEGDGSCMIVAATDAPLDARNMNRFAARAVFGLGRTGASYSQGSGDFGIAFSTSPEVRVGYRDNTPRPRKLLPYNAVSPLFQAVLEATEEAAYNALFKATTVTGNGDTKEAIPIDRVREILAKHR
jgi:D-aminopeptidase